MFRNSKQIFTRLGITSTLHPQNVIPRRSFFSLSKPLMPRQPTQLLQAAPSLFTPKTITRTQPTIHPNIRWMQRQLALFPHLPQILAVHSDMAGTLVNLYCTLPFTVFAEVFKRYSIDLTVDQITGPMGGAKIDHIRLLLEEMRDVWFELYGVYPTEADAQAINREFEMTLAERISNKEYTRIIPYVDLLMDLLQQLNIPITTTSGYTRHIADLALQEFLKQYNVAASTTSDEVVGGKRIQMIYANTQQLGLALDQLSRMIFITDAPSDIESVRSAPNKAHMPWIIGVSDYSTGVGIISQAHADSLSASELKEMRASAKKKLQGAHVVIDDLSQFPLVIIAIMRKIAEKAMPGFTDKLELICPEPVEAESAIISRRMAF